MVNLESCCSDAFSVFAVLQRRTSKNYSLCFCLSYKIPTNYMKSKKVSQQNIVRLKDIYFCSF